MAGTSVGRNLLALAQNSLSEFDGLTEMRAEARLLVDAPFLKAQDGTPVEDADAVACVTDTFTLLSHKGGMQRAGSALLSTLTKAKDMGHEGTLTALKPRVEIWCSMMGTLIAQITLNAPAGSFTDAEHEGAANMVTSLREAYQLVEDLEFEGTMAGSEMDMGEMQA